MIDLIRAVAPGLRNADAVAGHLQSAAARFNIPQNEWPYWVAQCAHESALFTTTVENLNYSGDVLSRLWPKRFAGVVQQYHRQPEKIANRAYANRMGNSDESSGDGWRYRGAGYIQLTGSDNQAAFFTDISEPSEPEKLQEPVYAALSAAWFWDRNRCGELIDNLPALRRRINGGVNGLAETNHLTELALNAQAAVAAS